MLLKWKVWGITALLSLGLFGPADGAEGKIKGVAFGDYYFVVTGTEKNENGFKFRRIYLTYDLKWNDRWSGRVRYEANDAGFGGEDKMRPFVKHGYLRYRTNGRTVNMGLFGTPTWNVSERIWGYRSIAKTIMDMRKIGSSADLGVGYRGKLDGAGRVNVQLMIGNGSGQRPEADNGKKVYSLLHLKPTDVVEATVYLDWEGKPEGKDRITFAGMLGTSGESFRLGIEGFIRNNRRGQSGDDIQVRGVSAFGNVNVKPRVDVFGRLDFYDPNRSTERDEEFMFIGGIDVAPAGNIHIMPNVVATIKRSSVADTGIIPRMTVCYRF
ncbi:MAG: porin [Gemmatimonadota bacterium]|nr:porin [Gemmatimonadota bacterium]